MKEFNFNKSKSARPIHIEPDAPGSMAGAGVIHKRQKFITHTTLNHKISAIETFTIWQKAFMVLFGMLLTICLLFWPLKTGVAVVAVLSTIYFIDVVFNFYLVRSSLTTPPEIKVSSEDLNSLNDAELPVYTILCPLYREAHILAGFVEGASRLDWPKDKLDVILLLEENDEETIRVASSMDLPSYIRIVVVPLSLPKTKPKACNYGLHFSRGEYLVVYDAEDIPEPQQLKKAYYVFQHIPESVKCLQAKLNYHNPHQNWLTRFFTAEYSLWFDVTLPGLQSVNAYIPLGGTSNHFRTEDLRKLEGWDPFNVTEDCDLGARIFVSGFTTAVIDSVTLEEANSNLGNWIRQRSRWIKGYMQTYLVHMRRPFEFFKKNGLKQGLIFQLVVGGKIAFLIINPILWLATIAYFAFYSIVGPGIESLYPTWVFYLGAISLVFGNFMFLYYYMIGAAKREHWGVIKYVLAIPIYWFFASFAALIAVYQLIVKPHYWEKTTHGLHLPVLKTKQAEVEAIKIPPLKPAVEPVFTVEPLYSKPELPLEPLSRWSTIKQSYLSARSLFGQGGVLIAAMMISNGLNFLFNAYLGRKLSFTELGLITLVNTLLYIITIFIGALSSTVNKTTAFISAKGKRSDSAAFTRSILGRSILVAGVLMILWLIAVPIINPFFQIGNPWVLIFFTPVLALSIYIGIARGYLQGTLRFSNVAVLFLVESVSKLIIAFALTSAGANQWVYISIPASILITSIASFYLIHKEVMSGTATKPQTFSTSFFLGALMNGLAGVVFLSLDILLVKHFMSAELAGQYILLALVGKMIFFFGSLPNVFTITLTSRDQGLQRNPARNFRLILAATLGLVVVGAIALGPFGHIFVPILLGAKANTILSYLNLYALAMALFTVANVIVSYNLARQRYLFPLASFVLSLGMVLGIGFFHASISQIVYVMLAISLATIVVFAWLHLAWNRLRFADRTLVDFFDVFTPAITQTPTLGKKILIFNWRDTKHVFTGGAEVYAHEMAKQWVAQGHQVTVFCGNDGKCLRNEVVDGVNVVRRGGFYFVYFWAFVYYMFQFRGKYDMIVDCHNGIPFFTPIYATEPVYCVMHHVHQEVFRHSLSKPLAWFACRLEKNLMPLVYRGIKFITVSESSKHGMIELGLREENISIVHNGVDLNRLRPPISKSETPLVLYLGRLKAYKSIDVLLTAFKLLIKRNQDAQLVIAGYGEEQEHLQRLASQLGVQDRVTFAGKVSEKEKIRLLQKSWVMVQPSFMEGWGITTIEANACGTPVVAADVPGLRDSVRDTLNGFLVPHGDSNGFARSILALIEDKKLRTAMGKESVSWAQNFDWSKTSENFLSIISKDIT